MASSFDFTVKIPSRFHNPWMSYHELCQYIQKNPLDLVIINNFNDICFYETVIKALKWEHNRLQLIQAIRNLKLCDVVEDIEFFSTLIIFFVLSTLIIVTNIISFKDTSQQVCS